MAKYMEDLMGIQNINGGGIQNTWEGELTERGSEIGPNNVYRWTQRFRLQIYMKYKCLNTKSKKLS